jgi:hypothetical protein
MSRLSKALAFLIVVPLLSGCIGWQFGPGFSARDTRYFATPPKIIEKSGGYVLAWTFGKNAFPFVPRYRVKEGRAVFSVQGMSSAWPVDGRYHEMAITGHAVEAAIKKGEAFWWQPDGSFLRIEIVTDEKG